MDLERSLRSFLLHSSPQPRVGRHAARDDDARDADLGRRAERRRHQHVHDCFLEARRDVGEKPLAEYLAGNSAWRRERDAMLATQELPQSSLQPAEAEIVLAAAYRGTRKADRAR